MRNFDADAEMLDLFLAGGTYAEIGEALGVSRQRVQQKMDTMAVDVKAVIAGRRAELDARIVLAFDRGRTQTQMMHDFEVGRTRVVRALERAGRNPEQNRGKGEWIDKSKRIRERMERTVKLYDEGWTIKEIAKELGVGYLTPQRDLKRAGVKVERGFWSHTDQRRRKGRGVDKHASLG